GDLQLSLSHQSDDTIMKMEEDRARIYRDGAKLDMTNIGQPVPQVWRVTNNTRRRHNTYNFTIFDGAGEIIRNIGRYPLEVRYIKASRAILLLLDPLRLQNLIANGGIWPEDAKNSHTAQIDDVYRDTRNAGAIVTAIADAICVARGMRKTRLDIPTAVVITKFDLLDHRLPAGSLVTSYGSNFRDGRVDLQACSQMDREIVAWLTAERETAFLEAVRSSFSNFTFFGVSNFGKPPPDEYSAPAGITPRRVLDPMLWLFHKLGFIDGGR
ncbi:MAG: hypothetical protein FWE76_04330, partial [Symbiobacteriaceae bacterium]|nr:hypothetical protein [Symbiobacteriaceae bacterium]